MTVVFITILLAGKLPHERCTVLLYVAYVLYIRYVLVICLISKLNIGPQSGAKAETV